LRIRDVETNAKYYSSGKARCGILENSV